MAHAGAFAWAVATNLALAACGGGSLQKTGSTVGGSKIATTRATLVRLPHCCATARRLRLAGALERELRQAVQLTVAVATATPTRAPPSQPPMTQVLRQARALYIGMHMTAAQRLLVDTWQRQRKTRATDAEAGELARLHAYLVAVYDALGNATGVVRHSRAAMRYFPDLPLDDDIFTPTVQRALRRAKEQRASLLVAVHSRPAGASIFWNGTRIGKSPVAVRDQAKGSHLLRVVHPLFAQWAEQIELSTSVDLRPELVAKSAGQIGLRVRLQHALGAEAVRVLATDGLLLVDTHPGGLALTLFDAAGAMSQHLVGDATSAANVARTTGVKLERSRRATASTTPVSVATRRPTAGSAGPGWRSHLRRYWWAYALGGAAAIAIGVALPLTLPNDSQGRDLLLDIP